MSEDKNPIARVSVREKLVKGYYSGSDSSSDDGKDDWTFRWKFDPKRFTPEYIRISKAMRFVRLGVNQESSVIGLALLLNCELDNDTNLSAIVERDGLETVINLVETNHIQCRIGALEVLKRITWHKEIVVQVMNLGLGPLLVKRLGDFVFETRVLACDIIANIGSNRSVSRAIRKLDGIGRLVTMVKVEQNILSVPHANLTEMEHHQLYLTSSAANALCTLSKFKKNRLVMLQTGLVPLLSQLILCGKPELTTPMMGVLSNCSSDPLFQGGIESDAIVGVLLKDLRDHYDLHVKKHCARALAHSAAYSESVRKLIIQSGGLTIVMQLLLDADDGVVANVEYTETLLNLIWKTSYKLEDVEVFERTGLHRELMNWLDAADIRVRIPVTGAIGELCKHKSFRSLFIEMGVINSLTGSLLSSNVHLITNAAIALGNLAGDEEGAVALRVHDCVRLLWSLLKHTNKDVRRQALWALKPFLRYDSNSGEETRSITGAMHLIITELRERDFNLLAAVCAIIAEVAKDLENLAVLSEKGVVRKLASLVRREDILRYGKRGTMNRPSAKDERPIRRSMMFLKGSVLFIEYEGLVHNPTDNELRNEENNENLRRELAAAIAECCTRRANAVEFGRRGVIPLLVKYLGSKCTDTRAQGARALWKMSEDMNNCIQIYLAYGVPKLLRCVGSQNQEEQISAAGCMKNVRLLLQEADNVRAVKPMTSNKKLLGDLGSNQLNLVIQD